MGSLVLKGNCVEKSRKKKGEEMMGEDERICLLEDI